LSFGAGGDANQGQDGNEVGRATEDDPQLHGAFLRGPMVEWPADR
jgi:hypothetical protein